MKKILRWFYRWQPPFLFFVFSGALLLTLEFLNDTFSFGSFGVGLAFTYALWMLDCPEFDAWCEKKFPRLYRFAMSLNPDHQDPSSPTDEEVSE